MSYKMGFILSLIFIIQIFFLGSDILCVQVIYSELDAVSLTTEYMIAKDAGIRQETIDFVENAIGGTLVCTANCSPRFGDALVFEIAVEYDPLIMDDEPMRLVVERSALIGYYN